MRTKTQFIATFHLLLWLLLATPLAGVAGAQPPTPLDSLSIALWPEYDQPETLVIFRGRVPEDGPLPASLSFSLPASVEAMHAVAYFDEEQRSLVNLADYSLVAGAAEKVLTFATPARQFQFEYYSGEALSTTQEVRELSFSFTPSADIASLVFEIQQPIEAQAFASDPPPSMTQVRQDGLTYALYDLGTASAGDSYSLQASYTRSSDLLSIDALGSVNVPTSPEQTSVEVGGGGLKDNLGPILIAAGVLLLIGALGYWFWSQRAVVVPEPARRQPPAKSRRAARKRPARTSKPARPVTSKEKQAAYCHRCGTKLREDARFCHACGAERRAE